MISEQQAIQLAKGAEGKKGKEKKEMLLRSAQIYVQLSDVMGNSKYLEEAEALYEKAQTISESSGLEFDIASVTVRKPRFTFKDIVGLETLKKEIALKIIMPFKVPMVYDFFDKQAGGGVLMYGPPGCGKSLIAEATAGEAKATFFHVKASDLKSKFVGETERNIAKLFSEARKRQPCIIFFDEFEALGEERTNASVHNRGAVSQLLTEMDGLGSKDQQILLLAATNEPWNIDSALKREGRFGSTVFVPPPSKESRKHMLQNFLAKVPVSGSLEFDKIALLTDGVSGADIKFLVEKAKDTAILDCLETGKTRGLTTADLLEGVNSMKPNLENWFSRSVKKLEIFNQEEIYPEMIEFYQEMKAR